MRATLETYACLFHELSHASHYQKAGSAYWAKYAAAIIKNPDYGDGSELNAGYIGVGEMWGNYFGTLAYQYFFKYIDIVSTGIWVPDEDWYNPGFMYDVDNTADVSTLEIYNCLINSTNTITTLKNKFYEITSFDNQVTQSYAKYTDWP